MRSKCHGGLNKRAIIESGVAEATNHDEPII